MGDPAERLPNFLRCDWLKLPPPLTPCTTAGMVFGATCCWTCLTGLISNFICVTTGMDQDNNGRHRDKRSYDPTKPYNRPKVSCKVWHHEPECDWTGWTLQNDCGKAVSGMRTDNVWWTTVSFFVRLMPLKRNVCRFYADVKHTSLFLPAKTESPPPPPPPPPPILKRHTSAWCWKWVA